MSNLDEMYANLYKNQQKIFDEVGSCECGSNNLKLESGDINWSIWYQVWCKDCGKKIFDSLEDEKEMEEDFIASGG